MQVIRNRDCGRRQLRPPAAWAFALALGGAAAPAFAETTVTGVEGVLLANVMAYLEIDDLACDTDEFLVQRALADAVGQSAEALHAYGYYAPTITTRIETGSDCWQAEIAIVPGEPVRLRTVDIQVEPPVDNPRLFEPIIVGIGLVVGAVFSHAEYDGLKR
jgi:translocation and assembly module TamA